MYYILLLHIEYMLFVFYLINNNKLIDILKYLKII